MKLRLPSNAEISLARIGTKARKYLEAWKRCGCHRKAAEELGVSLKSITNSRAMMTLKAKTKTSGRPRGRPRGRYDVPVIRESRLTKNECGEGWSGKMSQRYLQAALSKEYLED